ncbi:MAG: ABC transporter permease [Chloroflexia bacterium]|nr:ABC transporter permease [Chloroflexia bacterium]MDQ3412845.1 ABC transporter permease [Chloroflexota bacterium]
MSLSGATLATTGGLAVAERRQGRHRLLRSFVKHRLALAGLAIVTLLGLAALLAPVVATHDPYTVDLLAAGEPPSGAHWLGTDEVGRDVFSRLVYGSRVSLSVGLVAVTIATVIGTTLGAISGYFGGLADGVLQRLTDTVMCFPPLIVIIAAVSITGPSIWNVMMIIGLLTWTSTCRLVRGQFLALREREFVEAARALGVGDVRLIFRHVLPNAVAPVIVAATFGVAAAILTEAGLSFLGLGVQPPTASWGNQINLAQSATILQRMPWLWAPAGVLIAVAVLSINFVGDGLRDALDPRAGSDK